MLNIKFRNLTITAPDHDNLLRADVEKIINTLDKIFNVAEGAMRKNPPEEICYCVTRLNRTDKMIVAFSPGADRNPYIFMLDKAGRQLNDKVSISSLSNLINEFVVAELEANIKNIAASRFKCIQTEELSAQIRRSAKGR